MDREAGSELTGTKTENKPAGGRSSGQPFRKAGYVAVCGMSIALNIVFIMFLAATPLDSMACVLAVIVITPAMAKFGWRKAIPVYIGTALLGALFMEPILTVLYLCVGFHPLGADTENVRGKHILLTLLLRSILMGTVSAVLMLALFSILGFEDEFQGFYMLLVFPMMMCIAFSQGVVYRSARKLLYEPFVKPILKDL